MQLPEAIERVRRSVVQIQSFGGGGPGATLGSGFLVGNPMCVVTAKHVVDAVDFGAGETIMVGFALPDIDTPELQVRASFMGTGATVVATSQEHDLAVLSVPGAGGMRPALQIGDRSVTAQPQPARLSTARPRDGVAIAVSGYPLGEPSLVTTSGTMATSFALDQINAPQPAERYLGDITANPGNSGGPVYLVGDATVIGVCVAGRLTPVVGGPGAQTAGLTVIVRAAEVAALLQENGISSTGPAELRSGGGRKGRKRR